MKKVISLLLAIMMIAVVLAGCDGKTDKLVGTWKAVSVELDGTKYTISELEAMGDDSMSEAQIVIKESGKAYVADGNDGDIVDWVKTETGVKIGEQECTIVDGMICLEYGEGKVYFKKVSDSQTIGAVQDSDSAQENQDTQTESTIGDFDQTDSSVTIKNSPDKYTWYIKNYVGKNCASFGYTSMGGDRMDHYGAGYIELVLITPDGTYIDIETDDDLKQYVVTAQSYAPNTELKYVFDTDEDGNEYQFEMIGHCELNGTVYYAFAPADGDADDDGFCEYTILKEVIGEDGEAEWVSIDDDDEFDDSDAYESILDEANMLPERTLRWHYRSRHESLIAFSNAKIYLNNFMFISFPI